MISCLHYNFVLIILKTLFQILSYKKKIIIYNIFYTYFFKIIITKTTTKQSKIHVKNHIIGDLVVKI